MRRTKDVVAPDLPPKMIIDVHCPLSIDQKHIYSKLQVGLKICDDSLEQDLVNLRAEAASSTSSPLTAMMHLNMICVHPRLVDETAPRDLRSSGKLMELAKLLIGSGVVQPEGSTIRLK